MNWRTIHVYYHDEDTNALLLDAVRPLFRHLDGHAAFWTRHWRQGPHLRLTVRADDETAAAAAEEIVGGWLRAHPSTRDLDPDEFLPEHRRMAAAEQERGPLTPWQPNNSLRLAPFDKRVHVHGTEEMADLLADFYADTTPVSFEQIASGQRLMVAFDLMVTMAHTLTNAGIREGFVALRSHAEAFLNGHPDGGRLRPAWDAHHRRHADSLSAWLKGIVATLDGGQAVPFVRGWADVLRRYRTRAEELVADGRFFMPQVGFGPDSGLVQASPFHHALVAGPRWPGLRSSSSFALSRLLINYTYLQLTRLGVAPGERFLLCHLAANTVESTYDVSALDLVASTPAPK